MGKQVAYVCGGKRFKTLEKAKAYAEKVFKAKGIFLGIEPDSKFRQGVSDVVQ